MDRESLTKFLKDWQVLITALVAFVAALGAAKAGLFELNPLAWSWGDVLFVVIFILLVTAVEVRTRRKNASRLLNADALRLDPRSPDQLVGRSEDLDKIEKALANPLVYLVSESGCGKTALLRAGVEPSETFNKRFLPIYIDMSVFDWEEGPLRALRDGLHGGLQPAPEKDDSEKPRLDGSSKPEHYAELAKEICRQSERRPLLLLDQFDDYQATPEHVERFRPAATRVWRTADDIAPENAFWRVLQHCLDADALSIVVACREDAAKGLESLRFRQRVPQYDLARLERGLVRLIIDP